MKLTILAAAACLALSSSAWAVNSYGDIEETDPATKMDVVKQSLEELLNSGWEPIGFTGNAYLLKKGGKYIRCGAVHYQSHAAAHSYCVALN